MKVSGTDREWISRNRQNWCMPPPARESADHEMELLAEAAKAKKEDLEDVMSGDVFDYVHRKGLSVCLTCNAMKKAKAA